MGNWFSSIETWWEGLTSLRRFLLQLFAGWVITGVASYFASRFGVALHWWPLAIALEFIRLHILNETVAACLVTALVVGFWQSIVSALRKAEPILWAILPIGLMLFGVFILPNIVEWWNARNDPNLFYISPASWAEIHRKHLNVINIKPSVLVDFYSTNTTLVADSKVKPYIGKFIPIEGDVYDVDLVSKDALRVQMTGYKLGALLTFEGEFRAPIWHLQKGTHIKAICILQTVTPHALILDECGIAT